MFLVRVNQTPCVQEIYSLIQTKCQGGTKYALPITVKFDQPTRRFGRICFARLFNLTEHTMCRTVILSSVTTFTVVYERYKKCKRNFAVAVVSRPR